MKTSSAQIVEEYGPFPGISEVHGVTYDGQHIWFASGGQLTAINPKDGAQVRTIKTEAYAGTAFDGTHLFQIAGDQINRLDPATGAILSSIPTPGEGASGLAWAEGSLWVGDYPARRIHQIDPETGDILRSIESNRFVTGVTWVDGELWHGTWQDDRSDLRHVDPDTGNVIELVEMPDGMGVSGLESDGADRFYCGGGGSGKLRAVRRPVKGA